MTKGTVGFGSGRNGPGFEVATSGTGKAGLIGVTPPALSVCDGSSGCKGFSGSIGAGKLGNIGRLDKSTRGSLGGGGASGAVGPSGNVELPSAVGLAGCGLVLVVRTRGAGACSLLANLKEPNSVGPLTLGVGGVLGTLGNAGMLGIAGGGLMFGLGAAGGGAGFAPGSSPGVGGFTSTGTAGIVAGGGEAGPTGGVGIIGISNAAGTTSAWRTWGNSSGDWVGTGGNDGTVTGGEPAELFSIVTVGPLRATPGLTQPASSACFGLSAPTKRYSPNRLAPNTMPIAVTIINLTCWPMICP